VSPSFYLQDQQLVLSPTGGKLILDGRPLCCCSGDSAPFPLQLYCQIFLGEDFCDFMSDGEKKVHWLASMRTNVLRYQVTAQGH